MGSQEGKRLSPAPDILGLRCPQDLQWSRQIAEGGRTQPKWTQKCNKSCSKELEGQDEFAEEEERVQTDWGGWHSELMPAKGLAWSLKHLVVELLALLSPFQMHLYGFM